MTLWQPESDFDRELLEVPKHKPPISAAKIEALVKLALGDLKQFKNVVNSIERFIRKAPTEYKIAGVYCVDAITKASKAKYAAQDPYSERFSRNLASSFVCCSDVNDKDKRSLQKMLDQWTRHKLFPEGTLAEVQSAVTNNQRAPGQIDQSEQKPSNVVAQQSVWSALGVFENSGAINGMTGVNSVNIPKRDNVIVDQGMPLTPPRRGLNDDIEMGAEPLTPPTKPGLNPFNSKIPEFQLSRDNIPKHVEELNGKHETEDDDPFAEDALLTRDDDYVTPAMDMDKPGSGPAEVQIDELLGFLRNFPSVPIASSPSPNVSQNIASESQANIYRIPQAGTVVTGAPYTQYTGPGVYNANINSIPMALTQPLPLPLPSSSRSLMPQEDTSTRRRRSRSPDRSRSRSRSRSREDRRQKPRTSRWDDAFGDREPSRPYGRGAGRGGGATRGRGGRRPETIRLAPNQDEIDVVMGCPPDKHAILSSTIWVGNVSTGGDDGEFSRIFERFGQVDNITVMREQNMAFIKYARRDDASSAIATADGHKLDGVSLKVKWGREVGNKTYFDANTGVSYIPKSEIPRE